MAPTAEHDAAWRTLIAAGIAFAAVLVVHVASALVGLLTIVTSVCVLLAYAGVLVAAIWWLARRLWSECPGRSARAAAVIVLLAVPTVVLLRFVNPVDPVFGNEDQGTYAAAGAKLARTGRATWAVPWLAEMPDETRELATIGQRTEAMPGIEGPTVPHLMTGFTLSGEHLDRLSPVFPIGYPALLAAGYDLGGWDGLRWVTPLLGMLAVALWTCLATRWLGAGAGVASWCLLWLDPLRLWFANHVYAETGLQVLWALLLIAACRGGGIRSRAVLAGFAGIAGVTLKIDGTAMLAVLAIAAVVVWPRERRAALILGITALVALAALGLAAGPGQATYLLTTANAVLGHPVAWLASGLAVVATIAWAVPASRAAITRVRAGSLPWAAFGALVTLVWLVALFIRPHVGEPHLMAYWPRGTDPVPSWREWTLPRLAWYWTWPGVVLGIVGWWALWWQARRDRSLLLALGVATLVGAVFAYDLLNHPRQPYAMRRLASYTLPVLVLAMAAWWRLVPWPRWRFAVGSLGTAALVAAVLAVDLRLNRHADAAGASDQLDAYAAAIPEDAVLLIDRGGLAVRFAPYWWAVHDLRVVTYAVSHRAADVRAWQEACRRWREAGRILVDCGTGDRVRLIHEDIIEHVAATSFTTAVVPTRPDALATGPEPRTATLWAIRFGLSGPRSRAR